MIVTPGEKMMEPKEIRKPYTMPEIIHEMELETRAGSTPVGPGLPPEVGFPGSGE